MESAEYKYKVSVISAVYNCEEYLEEAIDSIINQTLDFENIQIVLVDDGSSDGSGEICDRYKEEYPDNIVVIHKENGGVSSARNEGLKYAEGELLNFMDADDKWGETVFQDAVRFMEVHPETDMVTFRMRYFDAKNGPHLLNRKFKTGKHVVDLRIHPDIIQNTVSCAFTRRSAWGDMQFDTSLKFAEDGKAATQIVTQKYTLGTIYKGFYYYRRHSGETVSATQGALQTYDWYLPRLKKFDLWALNIKDPLTGEVPRYIKYLVMYDMQWVMTNNQIDEVLSEEDREELYELVGKIVSQIDDYIIRAQKDLNKAKKIHVLRTKYEYLHKTKGIRVVEDEEMYRRIGLIKRDHQTFWHMIDIKKGIINLDGQIRLFTQQTPEKVILEVGEEKEYECVPNNHDDFSYMLDKEYLRFYGFNCYIPVDDITEESTVYLKYLFNGKWYRCDNYYYRKFFPIGRNNNGYLYDDKTRILVTVRNDKLILDKKGKSAKRKAESTYLEFLEKSSDKSARNAAYARQLAKIFKLFYLNKRVWMINDRINIAGDNGEAFFTWINSCKDVDKKIKPYFSISKDSPDYKRLKKIGKVVPYKSLKHKLLYIISQAVISSAGEDFVYCPLNIPDGYLRDIIDTKPTVFLQHGIAKDDISGWLNKYKQHFTGFIVTSKREYDSIFEYPYFYDKSNIWLTGLPRYDMRKQKSERLNQITIMPTWRRYLLESFDPKTALWTPKEDAQDSDYCKFYSALLNNKLLLDSAKKYGYEICYKSHPNFVSLNEYLNIPSSIKMDDRSYNEILEDTALMVNDYSSASIDFSYMYRPVIYCHFDKDDIFESGHTYTKGWYDYEEDGFGEVEYDVESTVNRIIEYMKNDCKLKDKYRKRIDDFFAYHDQNNSKRVYDNICKMLTEE